MIKIIEDGMEYECEVALSVDKGCEDCKLGSAQGGCHAGSKDANAICRALNGSNGMRLICTSATPVQDEAKVYGRWNSEEAHHLVGTFVDALCGNGKDWLKKKLLAIDDSFDCFCFEGTDRSIIREHKPRHLTQAQIIEAHPDLEGVELVGGWE